MIHERLMKLKYRVSINAKTVCIYWTCSCCSYCLVQMLQAVCFDIDDCVCVHEIFYKIYHHSRNDVYIYITLLLASIMSHNSGSYVIQMTKNLIKLSNRMHAKPP